MPGSNKYILCINCGSSSLKFGLYKLDSLEKTISGKIGDISTEKSAFSVSGMAGLPDKITRRKFGALPEAIAYLVNWLTALSNVKVVAAGHRVVQGGPDHRFPELITPELICILDGLSYLAPNHLPAAIAAIRAIEAAFPDIPQVACYDTYFHSSLPEYVKKYPLPAKYFDGGLLKYGFHGLSYEYVLKELSETNPDIQSKKVIIAHLGNGASMVAVKGGKSVDTTMGLTPLGGLVMSSRPGDLDPGVLLCMLRQYELSADQLDEILNKQSGLKAIAGSGDMRSLLLNEHADARAREGITTFCYSAKKYIGALAAALGGIDLLVFTGGIGENSAIIRERICQGLNFLGIELEPSRNYNGASVISAYKAKVKTMVIKADEEIMIAQHTQMTTSIKTNSYEHA